MVPTGIVSCILEIAGNQGLLSQTGRTDWVRRVPLGMWHDTGWLPHDARSVGGRPALHILLMIMLAGVWGCATVEDAALRTPEMGESIDGGLLPREHDRDLSIPNHSASSPMSGPAQSTSDGNDFPASFVPESDFEGKSSGLIVRTLARLRVGSIIPMSDEVSIRAPEIWSLRPPVVKALGDDLALTCPGRSCLVTKMVTSVSGLHDNDLRQQNKTHTN